MTTKKALYGAYAVLAYTIGMGSLLYLMGFMIDAPLPKTVDVGAAAPLHAPIALVTNIAILIAFLVPHSVMARPRFKAWWTKIIPPELERTTYIAISGVTTALMLWAWRPMPVEVWHIETTPGRYALYAAYAGGWLTIVLATFNIDHFAFFGLRQVWDSIRARAPRKVPFTARWLYAFVRHPISLGWLFVFWATPHMTAGHLVFALGMSLYIAIVTPIEEKDLVAELGHDYVRYRERVRGFVPLRRAEKTESVEPSAAPIASSE